MFGFIVRGRIRDARSGVGLGGLYVKAYDKDLLFDDLMGSAFTNANGEFEILSEPQDFRGFFEVRPDIYLRVYAPDRKTILHTTERGIRWNADSPAEFDVEIEATADDPALMLVDSEGTREEFDPGEPLVIAAKGLRRLSPHRIVVREAGGDELFAMQLISDSNGAIPETVTWAQVGLDDPRGGEPLTVREARERWAGAGLVVELHDDERLLVERPLHVATAFERQLVLSTDVAGHPRNGFEVGSSAIMVSVYNVPEPTASSFVAMMVPHQPRWHPGDPIEPLVLANGELAAVRVEIGDERRDATFLFASGEELRPGAYDFIVRPIRYGYEEDPPRLTERDMVTSRGLTGLVVREPFMASKVVLGGCVNMQPIAGRWLFEAPYMRYTDVFQVGEDVWAALNPAALDPGMIGKMVALYLVQHKSAAQWSAAGGSSLQHLAVLGGNPAAPRILTQSYCINSNPVKIWPAASQVGEYDIVADFGNNSPSAAGFVPDNSYDTPLDIIDGYMTPGFRIVPDPAVDTSHPYAGTFAYDQTTQGSVTVVDDWGSSHIVAMKAVVYFPADSAGATTASQISAAQPSYPMVVVVHGNSSATNSYLGYNYLLEHLARNGFIAASIHLDPGMLATDRARIALAHIDRLKTMFGTKAQNSIGMMGHSRGGEAVVIAAQLNQQQGLGHGIGALISLAPTSWIANPTLGGAWATPYLVVYGSMDGDVAGIADTGFELYDRANGDAKSMVFVHGSTHGRYNTVWGDTDITAGWSSLGPTDIPKLVNADAHEKIAKGYMTAFFRQHLRGEAQWEGIFKGEWIPAVVQAADGGRVRLYVQYEDTNRRPVDDFEGPHSATSWQMSTIGGSVNQTGLPALPVEAQTYPTDSHSPHETGALFVRWDNSGDSLRFDLPAGQRDVTGYAAVSIRIGQKVGGTNPAALAQDLRVTLADGSGLTRAVRVRKFAEIPPPHDRHMTGLTKSAMNTVRIPLHSYTIRCAGMPEVDLTNIVSVACEFTEQPVGEVLLDSVEFTQ